MRVALLILLVACKSGEDRAREDGEAQQKKLDAERAIADKEMQPYRDLEKSFAAALPAVLAKVKDGEVEPGIEKTKDRTIAPILRSTTYDEGVRREPKMWCEGRCDKEPWMAKDPATAGVLVIADLKVELFGKWVVEHGGRRDDNDLPQNAYLNTYTVRAVLVPEGVTVAKWVRYGSIPGIGTEKVIPMRSDEHAADITALRAGNAPPAEGTPPKTTLGGY